MKGMVSRTGLKECGRRKTLKLIFISFSIPGANQSSSHLMMSSKNCITYLDFESGNLQNVSLQHPSLGHFE
jgi:hypothetical protein